MMTQIKRRLKLFFLLCAFMVGGAGIPASQAQKNAAPIIIRDTEIENTFKTWIEPLLKSAGLSKDSVNLVLVQSSQVNAFVAGGANIFVYTGLIEKTEDPGEIIGVLAHELGHVAGGHLVSTRDAMERASFESILGAVLGAGAAIATGNGGAATAIISGTSTIAQRRFLSHSRVNESSADQAALRFMDSAGINPSGMESFLQKLESEELLPVDQQSEYMRTHPITRNRIEAVHARAQDSAYIGQALPTDWYEQHKRMKAKLAGFVTSGHVAWKYDDRDQSISARYARTIAAYREQEITKALAGIDDLLAQEPDNPYFYELKGQMLVEFGRVKEALPSYQKAVSLAPDAALIRVALAHALLESGGSDDTMREAIGHLERSIRDEPRSTRIHRLLATAYGRLGQESMAKLHLAEEAMLQRRLPYARSQAKAALAGFKEGSREWLQAQDLLAHIENLERMKS